MNWSSVPLKAPFWLRSILMTPVSYLHAGERRGVDAPRPGLGLIAFEPGGEAAAVVAALRRIGAAGRQTEHGKGGSRKNLSLGYEGHAVLLIA